jgi:hypothetical protein
MRALPLIAAALLVAAACRKRDAFTARDSAFIATMAELRALPAGQPGDSAARAAVLRRRGFTGDSLARVALALAEDPARASKVWAEIERRGAPGGPTAVPAAPIAPTVPPRTTVR